MSKLDRMYAKDDLASSEKKPKKPKDEFAWLQSKIELCQAGADYWKENREAAEDDLRFLSGEQWPSGVKTERENEGRPCLTNNVLPTFVDQVQGDQRQNKPAIKINPVSMVQRPSKSNQGEMEDDTLSNAAGTKDYTIAEVMTALVKNIEYTSNAETAYDMAFQASTMSGMGFLRIRSDYCDDESFDQDLKIEIINNQFSVTIDPNAEEFDRSDMMWCSIDKAMDKESFKARYPDVPMSFLQPPQDFDDSGGWFADKTVRVSELYERVPKKKTIALLSDGRTIDLEKLEKVMDELLKMDPSLRIVRTREVKTYEVYWYKFIATKILEGPILVPCTFIPVVPVFGKSINIKGKVIYRSLIRYSKDPQRMVNYWDSAATESVALAPKAPYIASAEQIEGYEAQWQTANTKNHSVLVWKKSMPNEQPPARVASAQVPAAEITLAMNAHEKIKSTMGIYDASLGDRSNETSGKAIIARQRQGDRGSYAFIDNLSKAIRQVGKILVDMIPRVYDTERMVRLKFEDNSEDFVMINQQIYDEKSREFVTIHDLSVAKYDVVVTTGPSYATQRMEAAESMIQFAQAVPESAAIIGDLIAQVMDWPNADVIAKRLRKTLPDQLLSPEERKTIQSENPEEEAPQPTPEQQVQMQELEVRAKEAEAEGIKAQSDIEIAKIRLQEATIKLQNDVADMDERIQDAVAEAIAQVMAAQRQRQGLAQGA